MIPEHTSAALEQLDPDLAARLRFVLEADSLKTVLRRNSITDGSRRENSGEHSWHLALMALVLAPHTREPIDTGRVVEMLLVHDLVEIDAGDAFVYDTEAREQKDELDPLCDHHHDLKTYDGWALIEGDGPRPMVPPDDPRHPRTRPPPDG